jgi:hypothetical protein
MSCRWTQRLGVREIPGSTQATGSLPGAACYLLVELEAYEAAPPSRMGRRYRAPRPKRPPAYTPTPRCAHLPTHRPARPLIFRVAHRRPIDLHILVRALKNAPGEPGGSR